MTAIDYTFPIILYVLLDILLIVLIILGICLIRTLKKVNKVVDDVQQKVSTLNGFFSVIDSATDAISLVSDRVVDFVTSIIQSLFHRRKKKKKEEEYGEE